MNDGFHGPSWNKSPRRRALLPKIKRADGSIATTPEEVANKFSSFFSNLYGRHPTLDPSVLNLLKKETCFSDLDATPTNAEIVTSINKLNASSPGASGLHARLRQAISSNDNGLSYIRHFARQFWLTKTPLAEWEIGLLNILPKKVI